MMIIQSDIKQDINRLFKSINRDILDEFSEEKIYPYVIRSNTSKEKELFIRKWYIDKVSEICQKHINNSPFKRVSMAYFYLHDSTFNPFNILNFEKYKSGGLLEKTFWNIIIERYKEYDNLIVKLVNEDNNIYFYQCTVKFSHFRKIDNIETFFYETFNRIYKVDIENTIEDELKTFTNSLIYNLNTVFNKNYNVKIERTTPYIILNVFNNKSRILKIMIQKIFLFKECCKIMEKYNENKDIICAFALYFAMLFFHEYTTMFGTASVAQACIDRQATAISTINELRYLQTNVDLWMPLLNNAIDAFTLEYNKYSTLTHAIHEIAINPEISFEDLYTVMKYVNDNLNVDYYSIL
jgi:hypothetical protein